MINAKIASVAKYLPPRRMGNDEIATIVDTSDEWIRSHTGIRYRHLARDDESASDLALPAAKSAIERAGLTPDEIDMVLLATSTPDYPGLPATASIVQDRLGIQSAGAMDIAAACSGFVYGLETARAYVSAGTAQNVLFVATEVYSKILNWDDRSTCVLFGDGAGAVVVTATGQYDSSRIMPAVLGSRGSGAESLYRSHGGSRNRYVPGVTPEADLKLKMDGRKVYNFAVTTVIEVIEALLSQNSMSFNDLKWVVPHQANSRIIQAVAKRADWNADRFFTNIDEVANTSAASIPIALDQMAESGLINRGDAILTVGFGAGLSWGGNVLIW